MCVGAVRRLVANLTVDQCLQKREAAIAKELQGELAPVVSGSGRPDDDKAVEAEAELATLARKSVLLEGQAKLRRAQGHLDAELRRLAAETRLAEGQHDAEVARLQGLAELPRAEAQARLVAAQNLPQLAAAIGQRVGGVHITQLGNENPFGSIAQAIHAVIELAHSASAGRRTDG